jgi:hypothetical protein
MEGFKDKAEEWLCQQFPSLIDSGRFDRISIGKNTDSDVGGRGGYRIKGNAVQNSALYLETPARMFPDALLADPLTRIPSVGSRISDSVRVYAQDQLMKLISQGVAVDAAQTLVADSITKIAYFDPKLARYMVEPVVRGVNDSILSGMQTPPWNVSVIQKIFKQPFLEGCARHLVSPIGVPNVWSDAVQIFTETFEGFARVSSVAHATPEFNTSITAKNRTRTMLSEFINLVIEFETSENEQIIQGQNGNWLTGATMGDREVYARLMLEQLMNTLLYFGHPESGFEGLFQIADRDDYFELYDDTLPPLETLWNESFTDATRTTTGADAVMQVNKFIADMMEELNFLAVSVHISCSPIVYKVLKWSMHSKVYNPDSPLKILSEHFKDNGNRIIGTMATRSGDGLNASYAIAPDPMLMPNTPFNQTDEDLMFVTFPELQSAMPSGLDSLVMAPTAIDFMVLPNWPHRDGTLRTGLKRIGSLLCPVKKCVKVISGFGRNSRYVG